MTQDQRLALRSVLSGVLSYAAVPALDKVLRFVGSTQDLGRSLPGLLFGLLVLAPAAPAGAHRNLRRAAAVLLSTLIYYAMVRLAVYEIVDLHWRDLFACSLSGFLGAVAVGIASRFALPLDVSPRQLTRAAAIGALTGALFGIKGSFPISGDWEIATLVLGFVAWQTGVAFACFRTR